MLVYGVKEVNSTYVERGCGLCWVDEGELGQR